MGSTPLGHLDFTCEFVLSSWSKDLSRHTEKPRSIQIYTNEVFCRLHWTVQVVHYANKLKSRFALN